jgi:hypothetical protein
LIEEPKVVDSQAEKKAIKRKFDQESESENKVVVEENKQQDLGEEEKVEEDNDPVRLWEDGWRQRYYKVIIIKS